MSNLEMARSVHPRVEPGEDQGALFAELFGEDGDGDAPVEPGADERALIRARFLTGVGYRLLASGKLWRARSRLYQRRFLQPNTYFSAFFRIYKIIIPLQSSKLKKLETCIFTSEFLLKFAVFSMNFVISRT